MKYTDINAQAVDQWVADGWEWGTPIDHETYVRAQQGDWQVLLTPTKPVPRSWFGELRGARVLGLASGGGQQMPVFAAAGLHAPCWIIPRPSWRRMQWWLKERATPSSWCGRT